MEKDERTEQIVLLHRDKTATAESFIEGFGPLKAIDGRSDTCWAASPYFKWWKLDLLQCYEITRISLFTSSAPKCYYHYIIEYSIDNLNWEVVVEKNDDMVETAEGREYEVLFFARYIRITITYCSISEVVQIGDFKVYGRKLGAKRLPIFPKVSPYKILATTCDQAMGFREKIIVGIEPGQQDEVLFGGDVGSYLVYRDVDFTSAGVDQFRGNFGFCDNDRDAIITIEIRLDDLYGERVGELLLFRQYTKWSVLACDLAHEDQSVLLGIHDVYLVITSSTSSKGIMLHWISFAKKSPLPKPKPRSLALPAPADNEYHVYFGNLHTHTGFTDGEGVPETAFDYARYVAGLDFMALTEHSNLYDNSLDWDKSRKWADIKKVSDEKTEDGVFVAIAGSETTWYNEFGHMNTFNIDHFLNTYELKYNDIDQYYETLKQYPDSINQWNHPWSCGNRHLDGFEPYDAQLDQVLHLIEVKPTLEGLSYYISALDKGWHVSPAGNQDNHQGQWGTKNNLRTAILAKELTRSHLYDAIRHNRVYFTSAPHMEVWFYVNDAIMGSRIKHTKVLTFNVRALNRDIDSHIVKAEIIGEGGTMRHTVFNDCNQMECTLTMPCRDNYYFLKVYQEDGEFAVTSPVWIG